MQKMQKNILIFGISAILGACAVNPTQPGDHVVASSSTDYTSMYRIGCLDRLAREEPVATRFHLEITKYEDRSWVCLRNLTRDGSGCIDERCMEASVPVVDSGFNETYVTSAGDTLTIGVGYFRVTGGTGCYVMER